MSQALRASILPTDQDDILTSTHDGEVIHGLGGNDTIAGTFSRLKLFGDAGNDMITTGAGDRVSAFGGDGNDTIYADGNHNTVVEGGKGADLIGINIFNANFPLAVTLSFAGSVQAVRVFLSSDGTGYGTAGDAKGDVYESLFSTVLGSAGDDWIMDTTALGSPSGPQSQRFDGAAGNDRLVLGTGDDTGLGGTGDDLIDGGAGNDRLLGNDGNDVLLGGKGHDVLKGGLGADHFAFAQIDMSDAAFAGSPVTDRIADFSSAEGDKIDLSLIDARAGQPSLQAFTFLGTGAFTGQQGEVRYEVSAHGVTVIAWDGVLHGNGATGQFEPVYLTFFLQGVTSLTAQDFIL